MMNTPEEALIIRIRPLNEKPKYIEFAERFNDNSWQKTPICRREDLQPFNEIAETAIFIEKIGTVIVEPQWFAKLTVNNHLILQ